MPPERIPSEERRGDSQSGGTPTGAGRSASEASAESHLDRLSRRGFMQGLGLQGLALTGAAAATGVGTAASLHGPDQDDGQERGSGDPKILGPDACSIALTVNGRRSDLTIDPATTLLEALRHHLDLTGSKEICDRGACGGCSVLIDGVLVASCMMLAVDADGAQVTTIEGLAEGDGLHPLQDAFVRHDALQCGFCTPGLVVACKALLDRHPKPTMEQIRRGLSGNICRCGTYTNIFNAVLEVSGQPVPVDPIPPTIGAAIEARPSAGGAP